MKKHYIHPLTQLAQLHLYPCILTGSPTGDTGGGIGGVGENGQDQSTARSHQWPPF